MIVWLSHLFPDQTRPQFGTFIYDRYTLLLKKYDINVISPRTWFPIDIYDTNSVPEKGQFGINKIYYPKYLFFPRYTFYSYNGYSYYRAITPILKKEKFKLIHAHQPYPDGYAGYLAKRDFETPLIITIHDGLLNSLTKHPIWKKLIRDSLNSADRITVVAPFLKEECKKIGVTDLDKIEYIPNFVNSERFNCRDKFSMRLKFNFPLDKRIILFVGHLYYPKGLFYLLESIYELKKERRDFIVILVGDGPLYQQLNRKVKKLSIQNEVIFFGARSHDDIPYLINACDILILPSILESFGMVLIEAMASCKPVIATTAGGIPDVVDNLKNGILVEPKNIAQLTKAIDKLLSDPKLMNNFGQNGRIEVLKKFSEERYTKSISKIYDELSDYR